MVTAARERGEVDAVAAQTLSECGEARVLPIVADVARDDDCARVVEATHDAFGPVDILVNNAGRGMKYVSDDFLTQPSRFWELEPQTWRMVIDTNVNGPFLSARRAVPVMLAAGGDVSSTYR